MAARRGKSQAKRNGGSGNPPWVWLGIGLVLGVALIVGVPKLMKGDGNVDGFFRPKPDPDARPVATASAEDDDAIVPEGAQPAAAKPAKPTYDFYTMLPANEVQLSDAEIAETERAESERRLQEEIRKEDAAARQTDAATPAQPTPAVAANDAPAKPADAAVATAAAPKDDGAHYLLQAGAFQASGDAEAVKAKIALLGLAARVESAQIRDKTVFRVRMGPYGSASELADAKRRLASGGLPAMAIKAR
jgi:cell division protein FtsN